MSEILTMTPKERKKRVRTDQVKANVGLTTALGGLSAAGLMLTPGAARNRAVKRALKNTKRPEAARAFLESKRPTLESAATKVLLYGAAPGAAVGVAHSSTARQDAKNLKSLIRSDGTLKPGAKDKLTKAAKSRNSEEAEEALRREREREKKRGGKYRDSYLQRLNPRSHTLVREGTAAERIGIPLAAHVIGMGGTTPVAWAAGTAANTRNVKSGDTVSIRRKDGNKAHAKADLGVFGRYNVYPSKDKVEKAAAPTAVGAGKALRRLPSIKKGNNLRRGGYSR